MNRIPSISFEFFPPKDSSHDAWSSINMQSTSHDLAQHFDVVSLDDLLSKYHYLIGDGLLFLKMDIEGAEVKIIPEICSNSQKFDFMGVELDFLSFIPFLDFKKRLKSIFLARKFLGALNRSGYKLVCTDNFNFFWEGPSRPRN